MRISREAAIIGLLFLLMVGGMTVEALTRGQPVADVQQRPSTYFTDPTGARALLLVLQQLVPDTHLWRRPPSLMSTHGNMNKRATLLVVGPSRPLSQRDAQALHQWIAEGGQLILATEDGWPVSSHLDDAARKDDPDEDSPHEMPATPADNDDTAKSMWTDATFLGRFGISLSRPTRHSEIWRVKFPGDAKGELRLWIKRGALWSGRFEPIAMAVDDTVAVAVSVGHGRLIAIADEGVANNFALGKADNAPWLISLMTSWGPEVWIDEYHHGFADQKSMSTLTLQFLTSPWGWGLVQILVAAALFLFGIRRRLGRPMAPLPTAPIDPIAQVRARSGLFEAAQARALALEQICAQLSYDLRDSAGRPFDLRDFHTRFLASPHPSPWMKQLGRLADLLERTRGGNNPSERELLEAARLAGTIPVEVTHERTHANA